METNYELVEALQKEAQQFIDQVYWSYNKNKKWWQRKVSYQDVMNVWIYHKLAQLIKQQDNDTNQND